MKHNRRNYYRILHIQQDAPVEIIKASYRTCMQKLRAHPDLGGDHWNAALLNEALTVLSNPEKRRKYDKELSENQTFRRNAADSYTETKTSTADEAEKKTTTSPTSTPAACSFCASPTNPKIPECLRCRSPLNSPVTSTITKTGNRAFERLNHQCPVEIYVVWPQAIPYLGRMHNLTPAGVMITLDYQLVTNQVIKLCSDLLDAVARVVSCKFDMKLKNYVLGLEFITLHMNRPKGTFISESA